MIRLLAEQIADYLAYLGRQHGWYLTLHDPTGVFSGHMDLLTPHNIHSNPYCLYVKSQPQLWEQCIACQGAVLDRCRDGMYFGMCYAGVEEYVFPLGAPGEPCGFVSVSGYRTRPGDARGRQDRLVRDFLLDREYLGRLYRECLSSQVPDAALVRTVLAPLGAMVALCRQEVGDTPPGADVSNADYLYSHLVAHLHRSYNQPGNLSQLAESCHCSVSLAQRVFQQKSGCSLHRYRTLLRLEEAKRLLRNTSIPIREVARRVGYEDSNYFSSAFHREYGRSPTAYRHNQ